MIVFFVKRSGERQMTEQKQNPLDNALAAVPDIRRYVATGLRRMAMAEHPYEHYCYASPLAKALWQTAAELIEEGMDADFSTNEHE